MSTQNLCDGGCGTIEGPEAVFQTARQYTEHRYCAECLEDAREVMDELDRAHSEAFAAVQEAHTNAVNAWKAKHPKGKYPHEPDA
jgi:hypothetical protein